MGDNNPNENNNGQQNADQQNQQPQYDQNQNQQNNPYQQPQYNQPQYQQPQYGGQSQQPQNQQYQQGNQQYQQDQQNQQNPYQQNQYQQYPQYQQPQKKDNGMAIGALICGIVGVLLGCCAWYITLPISIVGLVLGILCLKKQKDGRTMAIIGIVLCSFGILIGILGAIGTIALLSGGDSYWNNFSNEFNLEDYY